MEVNFSPPRITVLMAIYNCASTLGEALDSLLNQSYQRFKVILCDDASTDNTYEVAHKYVLNHPDKFILLRNKTNLKLPATLNRCLEHADTEYVARMDGDDISKPDRFQKEIDFLDNNQEYALVSCSMEFFDENGVFMIRNTPLTPAKKDFIRSTPHAHAPVMIRTNILKKVSGYTDKKWTHRGQDYHLWAKIYNAGYRGYNLQEPLYSMRDDCAAFKRRNLQSAILGIRRVYEIYKLMDIPKYHLVYEIKSLAVALAPKWLYDYFHRRGLN